ncbi:pollen receptor-like kinase 1 [Canna indica]|uniref:Pollen receptor-like kinase 1 n=1 Tax=Canna indica TaxID=4628 RepID=A0AAQ3KRT6_9LILI|nr:pollen receptor-like kinase 1 [Canna indica]
MASQRSQPLFVALLLLLAASSSDAASSPEADVLLQFKATLSDPTNALKSWDATKSNPCANWAGVICDNDGKVSGLRLEEMSLSGALSDIGLLDGLPGLRTLSFIKNSFEGPMPEVAKLQSLRALFLSSNKFTGVIPENAFEGMSWLKKLYLSDNDFSGPIPMSIAGLPKLLELGLDRNRFSGMIPPLKLNDMKLLNLSNNNLEGSIPESMKNMKPAIFAGNKGLCGKPLQAACQSAESIEKPVPAAPSTLSNQQPVVIAAVAIFIITGLIAVVFLMPRQRHGADDDQLSQPLSTSKSSSKEEPCTEKKLEEGTAGSECGSTRGRKPSASPGGGKDHDHARLIFVRQGRERFELQDLLKSSAEVLGTGHFGCAYRASLSTGHSMVVKRFRDMNRVGKEDFEEHMRRLGRLSHTNLLPLVAYYYRKDEKLLVTDYVAKKSLAHALHGSRAAVKSTAALDWPTRLKIVRGIAKGLNYLYEELQMLSTPHGHLKAANVLLSDSFEPLLADYALVPVMNQTPAQQFMISFKSPESKQEGKTTKKSDVWSLGILILEILTSKIPTTVSPQGKEAVDLPAWVSSVAEEEWTSKVLDPEMKAGNNSEGEIIKLLKIGLACCEENFEKRCELEEVLDKLEELKEEGSSAAEAKTGDDLSLVDIN